MYRPYSVLAHLLQSNASLQASNLVLCDYAIVNWGVNEMRLSAQNGSSCFSLPDVLLYALQPRLSTRKNTMRTNYIEVVLPSTQTHPKHSALNGLKCVLDSARKCTTKVTTYGESQSLVRVP